MFRVQGLYFSLVTAYLYILSLGLLHSESRSIESEVRSGKGLTARLHCALRGLSQVEQSAVSRFIPANPDHLHNLCSPSVRISASLLSLPSGSFEFWVRLEGACEMLESFPYAANGMLPASLHDLSLSDAWFLA